jgi:putative ABC transport system ATP-binding protein
LSELVSQLVDVTKTYQKKSERVTAVRGASLSVVPGDLVAIIGPSGAGKTTLLNLMAGLETPSGGEVFLLGKKVSKLSLAESRRMRLTKVGFVFQQFKLIPTLSAIENIELPMALASKPDGTQRRKALDLLEQVGLKGLENRKPNKLSVGQQQRIAIARALANEPQLILADEPTSQLDSSSGARVIDLLSSLRKKQETSVVISTHDPDMVPGFARIFHIRDGMFS